MRNEDEILDELALTARQEMAASARGLRAALKRAVDPNPWLDAYPLQTMGAAAAAGFFAGRSLSRRHKERKRRRVRADRADRAESWAESREAPRARRGSRVGGLLAALTHAAGRAVVPAVTSFMRGLAAPDGRAHGRSRSHNGHAGHARRREPPEVDTPEG